MDKNAIRKNKVTKLIESGATAPEMMLFEHVNELEDKVDEALMKLPDLNAVLASVKGQPGITPEKGKDYNDGAPGQDYILTDQDKIEIATQIEVPIVEKV